MSGKDLNPFADPKEINPFAASPSSAPTTIKQVSDYNPFAEEQVAKKPPAAVYAQPTSTYASTPVNLQANRSDPSPTYQSQQHYGSNYGSSDSSMRQRQEELEKKAAELDRKEQELQRKQNEQMGIQVNNFPPLPSFCCIKPCYYHDINVDIPAEKQRTCRLLFYIWQLYIFTLVFNVISALALLISDGSGATVFGISILYAILFVPCSFVCWYRPIYKALKSDSSFNYMLFFVVFFFQVILCAVYSLGISAVGTVGWINGAAQADSKTSGNKAVSAMMFITAALWTVLAILMALLLRKVHTAYRQSGASFEKAQGEFARGIASNKNVQNAAAEAVKDPSITSHSVDQEKNLNNYSPFEKQATKSSVSPSYNTSPAMIEPTRSDPPPVYQQRPFVSSNPYGQTNDRQRQDELERKAAELEKKEQELKKIQSTVQKANNFPPLPKFFCVKPCFYHDISLEIPVASQRTCKMLFYIWQLYVITLFFNFLTSIALLATGGANGGTTLGVSILYMVLFAPCSFICWYRPIYKALKSDSSFNYMMFFFVFFFQIIFDGLCALGLGFFGSCGWINAADQIKINKAVAGMMFVCGTLWTLLALFKILLLRKVHSAYRRSGASFEKAQGEFARGVASNKNVQNAAAEAVKGGLQSGSQY